MPGVQCLTVYSQYTDLHDMMTTGSYHSLLSGSYSASQMLRASVRSATNSSAVAAILDFAKSSIGRP